MIRAVVFDIGGVEPNVAAARQAGIKAILFMDTPQAITEIEALLARR